MHSATAESEKLQFSQSVLFELLVSVKTLHGGMLRKDVNAYIISVYTNWFTYVFSKLLQIKILRKHFLKSQMVVWFIFGMSRYRSNVTLSNTLPTS